MIIRFARTWPRLAACTLLAVLACPITAIADEFRPALLEIHEHEGGWIDVTWKVPRIEDRTLALTPVLPAFLKPLGPGSGRRVRCSLPAFPGRPA